MRSEGIAVTGPASVLVAVPVGRNVWASRQATLHYAESRLVQVEGIDLPNAGPNGLTGTLYVVRDEFWRDHRRVAGRLCQSSRRECRARPARRMETVLSRSSDRFPPEIPG